MSYQGWKNYETWAVALWLDNEEPSYRYWNDAADEALEAADDKDEATGTLARQLKDEIEESVPELDGLWADLLGAAVQAVDWYEIAEHYLSDKEKETHEEEIKSAVED